MSVAGKALKAISEYGDDAVRAAAEFGDDAVRSILSTTPTTRDRLAKLAERRVVSTVLPKFTGSNKGITDAQVNSSLKDYLLRGAAEPGTRVPSLPMRPNDDLEMAPMEYLVDAFTRRAPNKDAAIFELATRLSPDEVSALARRDEFKKEALRRLELDKEYFKNNAEELGGRTIEEAVWAPANIADKALKEYQDSVLAITSGKVPKGIEAEMSVSRRARELNDALAADYQRRGLDYATKYGSLPNTGAIKNDVRLSQTALPGLTSQLDLAALLRMIGSAQ